MVRTLLAFILAAIFALPIGSQVFVRRAARIPAASGPLEPTYYESWEGTGGLLTWVDGGEGSYNPDYAAAALVGAQSVRASNFGSYYTTNGIVPSRTNWGSFTFVVDTDTGACQPHITHSRIGAGNDIIIMMRKPGASVMRAHAGSSAEWVDGTTTITLGTQYWLLWQYKGSSVGGGNGTLNIWLNTTGTFTPSDTAEIAITGGDNENNSTAYVLNQGDAGVWRLDELKIWNGAADPR